MGSPTEADIVNGFHAQYVFVRSTHLPRTTLTLLLLHQDLSVAIPTRQQQVRYFTDLLHTDGR